MTVFPKIRSVLAPICLLLAGLLLWHLPVLGQQTTGTVTGVVQDVSGAEIAKATVILINLGNKTERKTISNGEGNFTLASVESALLYQLTITAPGFDTWKSQPFPLRPGDRPNFTDIKLQVQQAAAEVTVEASASQAVKPLDTPERADVLTAKDLETLAIVGRDATELIETLPGFSLVSPGVANTSSANTAAVGLNNNITGSYSGNGTGPTGLKTVLDGVSLTDIQNNTSTVQTVNPDMIQEVKVSTSFSAVGAKGPEIFNATTKAGTSSYHGEGYIYARDTAFNANDWYNNYLQQTRPDGRYLYPGGNIGGPLWIPGTRFTHNNNKLFFFAGIEFLNQRFSPYTLGSYTPTVAERNGDFSVANLNAQLCGSRPDGLVNPNSIKAMCYAENYLADGVAVPEGNLTNFVDPLTGQAAANAGGVALVNWLPLPNADPFHNLAGYNYVQPVVQTQNGDMFHARLDYSINDNNKIYASYGRQAQITDQPAGLGYAPNFASLYPGAVTTGDISNIVSLTYTRVISANVTNSLSGALSLISDPGNLGNPQAVSRFYMNNYNCNDPAMRAAGTCGTSGHGNFNYLGDYKQAGDFSVPALNDYGGNLGYPNIQMPGGFYNNQVHIKKTVPDVQDNVGWNKGKHFFQFGIYYEKGILNGIADTGSFPQGEYSFNPGTSGYQYSAPVGQVAQYTGCINPQSTGTSRTSGAGFLGECINPIAMMYTGTPDSFQQTNFTPIVDMQYTTLAGYANDEWKLTRRLTLVLGARVEHLGPWVDRHGNGLAVFSPGLYKSQCSETPLQYVNCGPTNAYPGVTWHGADSSVSNSVNNPATAFVSPRVGLAYDIFGNGNTYVRGGWGIYRNEEEFAPYALAAATAQGYKTTRIQNQYFNFTTVDEQAPTNPADFSIDTLTANDTVRPTYYVYNGTISQRLKWNSLLEVAYVGSNSQNLSTYNASGAGYNEASDVNLIPAGYFFGTQQTNGFCTCNLPTILSNQAGNSINGLNTAAQDYFRPYPFYNHIYSLKHDFYGNYNSVQVSWNKSSGHVQYGANYTFSKALATAASYNGNLVDPINLRNDYNPAPFDRTHAINAHYLIDIGKPYKGGNHLFSQAANGWQISGISVIQSGVNLASAQGENFGFGYGSLQVVQVATPQQGIPTSQQAVCVNQYNIAPDSNGQRNCVTNLNPAVWLGTPDYELMPTLNCNPSGGKAAHQYINPTCFGIPLPGSPTGGTGADYSNPTGQGVYRLPYIRGPIYQNHNLSVYKNFAAGENKNLQFGVEGFNFLNHPLVSFNNNDSTNLTLGNLNYATAGQPITTGELSSPSFGIANIKYGSRLVELRAKFSF